MSIKKGTVTIASSTPVTEWGSIEGNLSDQSDVSYALNTKAPLLSPSFTGIPTVPTASEGTNTNQIASTKFVNTTVEDAIQTAIEDIDVLPDQTGQSGKFLKTNGTSASWSSIPNELPSQSGQSGKILSTNGSSAQWITYNPSPSTDGTTVNLNTSNNLQAIGVIDKNSGDAKYDWVGTYAQWEAGRGNNSIPDSWICYITDDYIPSTVTHNIGDVFYSLRTEDIMNGAVVCDGSSYNIADYSLGNDSIKNLLDSGKLPYVSIATFNSTVTSKGSCRCFGYDGSSSTIFKVPKLNNIFVEVGSASTPSEFIDAGLPNLTGTQEFIQYGAEKGQSSGVFSNSTANNYATCDGGGQQWGNSTNLDFNASLSNSIYGNSDTVQPNAVKYRAFIQLANATSETALQTVSTYVNDVDELKDEIQKTLQYKHITNCITEIPQNIDLRINFSQLTLKAGSKVYIPNGFEQDGTTKKFDEITLSEDAYVFYAIEGPDESVLVFYNPNNNTLTTREIEYCSSGDTAPADYGMWYDTTNNKIKYYSGGSVETEGYSLPVARLFHGINFSPEYIFNGFGHIGSTIFALPGLKGLMPNGRNEDGTLKNIEYTVSNVIVATNTSTANGYKFSAVEAPGTVQPYEFITQNNFNEYFESDNKPTLTKYKWFDTENNLQYWHNEEDTHTEYHGLYPIKNFIIFNYYIKDGKILDFYPRKTFRALDYNDKTLICGWGMPSGKYIDLTLGESGTEYTAPANGWVTFGRKAGGADKYIHIGGTQYEDNIPCSQIHSVSSSNRLFVYIPVKKGQSYTITYSASGDIEHFRFIYAQGEV